MLGVRFDLDAERRCEEGCAEFGDEFLGRVLRVSEDVPDFAVESGLAAGPVR